MKITFKGDYALKAVLDLARNYNQGLSTINDIAKRIDAPIKFLEQVLLDLKKGGFVESRRGNIGGYLLSRPPSEITVGEVVRFIDGPIEPIACVKDGYTNCGHLYKCVFRKMWQDIATTTAHIIDNVTFEQLVFKVDAEQKALVYSI
ncbi:MAG TPA: Rrf2 family transcriptional regulator [Candidatus Omnitrophota bacterium]|nr:Rrf2 family transcriptional regulator [Candidatus Omnitrophota bacterium]HPN87810.1 Rrf2 family transcriptional regulator [Candidatus Omnitrophota bacterium]